MPLTIANYLITVLITVFAFPTLTLFHPGILYCYLYLFYFLIALFSHLFASSSETNFFTLHPSLRTLSRVTLRLFLYIFRYLETCDSRRDKVVREDTVLFISPRDNINRMALLGMLDLVSSISSTPDERNSMTVSRGLFADAVQFMLIFNHSSR